MGIDAFGHTRVTPARSVSLDDVARAQALSTYLRARLAPYRSLARAEADGFVPSAQDVAPGELKHLMNEANVRAARRGFDLSRPSALLYRRTADGFELAGAMYTAPLGTPFEELDRRIPLSLGQWHAHRNVCVRPRGAPPAPAKLRGAFGFSGSIVTREACARAGGAFLDDVYGWMVHVYPYEAQVADRF